MSKQKKEQNAVQQQQPTAIEPNAGALQPENPSNESTGPLEVVVPTQFLNAISVKQEELGKESKEAQTAMPELGKACDTAAAKLRKSQEQLAKTELAYFKELVRFQQAKLTVLEAQNSNFIADYELEQQSHEVDKADMYVAGYIQAMKDATLINTGVELAKVKKQTMKSGVLTVTMKEN